MLNDAPVSAILPATNLKRAKDFYQNKLGLKLVDVPTDDPLIFEAGDGTSLVVYYRPEGTKAEHIAAGFTVKDLEKLVSELEAKGIKFEDYNQEDVKTVNHIMDYGFGRSAWFKDTEGNILTLNEMSK